MKAVILAGGLGERIKPVLKEIPKVLAPINESPFIEYVLLWLKKNGVTDIILCTGHKGELIENEIGDGKKYGMNITYSREESPLGTGGALVNAKKFLNETFILVNGDCIIESDIQRAITKHKEEEAISTIILTKSLNPEHQEIIHTEKEGEVSKVLEILSRGTEEHNEFVKKNKNIYCNSGVYIFEPEVFLYMPSAGRFNLESMLFPFLFSQNKKINSFYQEGKYIEIGNPLLYANAQIGDQLEFLISLNPNKLFTKPPVTKTIPLRTIVEIIQKEKINTTLLGIGPMSELVVESALELGKEFDFPILFIASRSQIDNDELGGGYVNNWNQKSFKDFVQKAKLKTGFHGLLYLCRDHGGPWQRPNEKSLPYEKAIELAKKSYLTDIENGFNFLHLDITLDPSLNNKPPLDLVSKRTIEVLQYIEEKRKELNLPPISYEFGTDETSGSLTSFEEFEYFIEKVLSEIKMQNLPIPTFIVGQTGTLVRMKRNTGRFDVITAKKLLEISEKYSIGFKEHNCDYIPEEDLKAHPLIRLTASNVAPEFGVAETTALLHLAAKEEIAHKMGEDIEPSNFFKIISEEVIKSETWKKWLTPQERNLTAEQIERDYEKKLEITLVAGHYTFSKQVIKEAREKLYENIKYLNLVQNPEEYVKDFIKQSIKKYVDCFNLNGITTKLLNKLQVQQ
jgi:dTDP-glucose pyrophosphorylase/tagatose-1,6-bisphosphate aldolase non-catalytic subunit AgaZ/GatZ